MSQPLLLDHATQTMANGSKSFATAAKLFDPATRRSVLMLYTWCRHCDDVIDDQSHGFASEATAEEEAIQRLARLRKLTLAAFEGAEMQDPAFAAFQEVALTHGITPRMALDHLDGFAMDVAQTRYVTFEDTLRYCYHVAGVVGLMMARVMGVRDERVLDRACDLGLAFQLTNIARDIIDDAAIDRCYLPAEWLHDAGLTEENYAARENRAALARVAERLIDAAEPYYISSQAGLHDLPPRCAWAIATARSVYREIGIKVKAAGGSAWDRRQHTSKGEKIAMLMAAPGQVIRAKTTRVTPRPAGLWQRPV
ncbi:15-cis-phytoene synthase CrtB [Pseudescherichia sp.]|uniref:15-cis-phytoene synthase CrtB n=1 Tax=Pseudescherichia sp. TaxID=2055881 RepID=UPI002899FCCB|nr:15-cis-phytoene synthase CrtB [Pseudescherichia sp.]